MCFPFLLYTVKMVDAFIKLGQNLKWQVIPTKSSGFFLLSMSLKTEIFNMAI